MPNTKQLYSKLIANISKYKKISDKIDIVLIITEHKINTRVTNIFRKYLLKKRYFKRRKIMKTMILKNKTIYKDSKQGIIITIKKWNWLFSRYKYCIENKIIYNNAESSSYIYAEGDSYHKLNYLYIKLLRNHQKVDFASILLHENKIINKHINNKRHKINLLKSINF